MGMSLLKQRHDQHLKDSVGLSIRVEYVNNDKGSMQVEFCNTCGLILRVMCECKHNTWHDKEGNAIPAEDVLKDGVEAVVLRCNLCGVDNT